MRSRADCRIWTLCCAALAACVSIIEEPEHPHAVVPAVAGAAADGGHVLAGDTTGFDDKVARPSHLPCAIEALINARCKNCHAPSTLPNRPASLLTYEELIQPSPSAPGSNYAQQAEQLVRSGMMPPTGALAAVDAQLLSDWVRAGAPPGECSGALDAGAGRAAPDGGDTWTADASALDASDGKWADVLDPYATATRCSSGTSWTGAEMGSALMHPGRACIGCHTAGAGFFNLLHGPSLTLAGTLYPSAHEPDDCNGAGGDRVSIRVTDANGQSLLLAPNAVGNFGSPVFVVAPYMVEVQYEGRTRATMTPHQNGDCNACHTEQGLRGAPGRIMLP